MHKSDLRALILALTALVAAVGGLACGGGGAEQPDGGVGPIPPSIQAPHPPQRAVESLVKTLGDKKGAIAALLAADRGYSGAQIIGAAVDNRLSEAGQIRAASGQAEPPAGPPYKRFTTLAAAPQLYASLRGGRQDAPSTSLSLDDIEAFVANELSRREVRTPKAAPAASPESIRLTALIIGLLYSGYSIDQIVEGVTLGNSFVAIGFNTMRKGVEDRILMMDRTELVCPRSWGQGSCATAVAIGALDTTVIQKEAGVVLPSAVPPTSAPATSNRAGVDGTVTTAVEGFQIELNKFEICFPRAGGNVEGKLEMRFVGRDEDCEGRFVVVLTLGGAYAAPKVSGTFSGSATVTLTGACAVERVIFDQSTPYSGPWEGTLEASALKATLFVDPEDNTDILLIEGRVR